MAQPPIVIGPYRLVRKLGQGGMGEVYEAIHQTIERQVAIKFLRPSYAHDPAINQRFVNEARAVNLIKHPGLVQISDFGELDDGSHYIVMEYLRGETLRQRLRRIPERLPLAQVLYVTWQVASALVAAHAVGITHRDLKPDNIMLTSDPVAPTGERAKLLDFGIARLEADSPSHQSLTGDRIMGTPSYMSPEQCRGGGVIGVQSDVYSLGVVLFELLAGHPPFVAEGAGELINMHLSHEPPPLAEYAALLPADLPLLVHCLLQKSPEKRPTMPEVVAELERLVARFGGLPFAVATPGATAFPAGLAGKPLAEPLAGILGSQIEDEGSIQLAKSGVSLAGVHEHWAELKTQLPSPTPGSAAATRLLDQRPTAHLAGALASHQQSLDGTGERLPTPPWPSAPLYLVVAALCGGGMVAAVAFLLLMSRPAVSGRVGPLPDPVAPPLREVRQTVSWSVDSLPTGARVVRLDTNQDLGATPWHREQAAGSGSFIVRLRYPGFAEKQVQLDDHQSSNQRAELIRIPAPVVRSPAPHRIRESPRPVPQPNPSPSKVPDAPSRKPFEVVN